MTRKQSKNFLCNILFSHQRRPKPPSEANDFPPSYDTIVQMGPPPTFEQSTGLPGYEESAGPSVITAEVHTGATSLDGRQPPDEVEARTVRL